MTKAKYKNAEYDPYFDNLTITFRFLMKMSASKGMNIITVSHWVLNLSKANPSLGAILL
jgi:hypothetical protein